MTTHTTGPVTYIAVDETPLRLVDCPEPATVRAVGPVRHRCPYKDEVDRGTVTVTWTTNGCTYELHSLRDYLDTYRESKLSHEAVAALILMDLSSPRTVRDVMVTVDFETAGFACRVDALPDEG